LIKIAIKLSTDYAILNMVDNY